MAGTVRGKIECWSSTQDAGNNTQEVFKAWFDFMEALDTAGVVTRVALQYGSGGTGTDYHDGANPFGPNAFALYRWPSNGGRPEDVYLLGQWSDGSTNFGASPGDPGLINAGTGSSGGELAFAWACAFESDGTTPANPWTGSTVNDGTDRKGATPGTGPVWEAPVGGTVSVWPRSNTGGTHTHDTDKENMVGLLVLGSSETGAYRYGFIADNDNFFAYVDVDRNETFAWCWFGPITPRTGFSPLYSLSMVKDEGPLDIAFQYGDTDGNDSTEQGGFYNPNTGDMEASVFTSLTDIMTELVQPSELGSSARFEEFPIYLYLNTGLTDRKGTIGTVNPFLKVVGQTKSTDAAPDLSRITLGGNFLSSTQFNITVPWDGTTNPRSNFTRAGVSF